MGSGWRAWLGSAEAENLLDAAGAVRITDREGSRRARRVQQSRQERDALRDGALPPAGWIGALTRGEPTTGLIKRPPQPRAAARQVAAPGVATAGAPEHVTPH